MHAQGLGSSLDSCSRAAPHRRALSIPGYNYPCLYRYSMYIDIDTGSDRLLEYLFTMVRVVFIVLVSTRVPGYA